MTAKRINRRSFLQTSVAIGAAVQAGMLGPAYESALNNAESLFGTERNYCCGHYPQSFEYSKANVVTLIKVYDFSKIF